ncbi:hypothetical protein EDD22DRAFT_957200 [Suillus occidentalis]|nr:hypothetical protein EDD22DRAFT_957200 [Suillus occidentalis]
MQSNYVDAVASQLEEYWESYHEHPGALDLLCHPTSQDWALNVTDIASAWVEQQFAAHVAGKPLVPAPVALDPEMMIACGQLASVLAEAYQHPIKLDINVIRYNEALTKRESRLNDAREDELLAKFPPTERMFLDHPSVVIDSGYQIILWYLPATLNWSMQKDMYIATSGMGSLLQHSITAGTMSKSRPSKWSTHHSNFHSAEESLLTPGCINISPCWFQQGHERHGPPPTYPEDGFMPEVSVTLKADESHSLVLNMQWPGLLSSAALRIMHPQLYQASISTQVELGCWVATNRQDQMYQCLQQWTSMYTGAAIICNRQSPFHRDPKCPPEGFDILTCIGGYDNGVMQLTNLGINIAYNSGVMMMFQLPQMSIARNKNAAPTAHPE